MIDIDNVKGKYCSKQELIFYFKACEEVKQLREDIVSILGAIDLPDYDEFPLTQEELRNMMIKYGQEHLTGRDE